MTRTRSQTSLTGAAGLRYLWWLVTSQRGRAAVGATWGSVWMVGLTLPSYLLSRAIDDGLEPGDRTAFLGWTGVLLATGVLTAGAKCCAVSI
ncbi:hypothetical protein [Streptomyces sp. NBC_01429]|uniref:hypothetical protein n=1 Tax=Streptomyces sp. NBC_01429 TaxID=2903862 RepID=UPI002E2E3BCD|nr:hypothetical protein [Streptomyces sp. NBC_01429]